MDQRVERTNELIAAVIMKVADEAGEVPHTRLRTGLRNAHLEEHAKGHVAFDFYKDILAPKGGLAAVEARVAGQAEAPGGGAPQRRRPPPPVNSSIQPTITRTLVFYTWRIMLLSC